MQADDACRADRTPFSIDIMQCDGRHWDVGVRRRYRLVWASVIAEPTAEKRLIMKSFLCVAIAAMVLSTGSAFAGDGGGDGGSDRYYDPNTAPPGFYQLNGNYQRQQAREAYVINQERAWQLAHSANRNPRVARSTTSPNG
jgi:hypothetical protein